MTYKLISDNLILRITDGANIPLDPGNRDYQEYREWLAEGNTPERADPPPPPAADWRGFLQALRGTTVFAALRGQSRTDVAANALATELRTALGEAALGLVEADVIQALVDELLPALAPEQIEEIGAGISAFNIPLSIAAP